MSVVSTWSDPPPQPSAGDTGKPVSVIASAEDWLLGTLLVVAVVLGAAVDATQSATIAAFVTASLAVCASFVPWLWTAWLERRSDLVVPWRLMAACLGVFGAAELASAITAIGGRDLRLMPVWPDLLRLLAAALGIGATVAMVRRRRQSERIDRLLVGSGAAAALSIFVLIALRLGSAKAAAPSPVDWLIAWAAMSVPLATTLIWCSALPWQRSDGEVSCISLAAGWLCLTAVMSGHALDRMRGDVLFSPRTSWAALSAGAFLGTVALGILRHRPSGNVSWLDRLINPSAEAGRGNRNWLRTVVPYLAFATAVTFAIDQAFAFKGPRSLIIVSVSSVFAAAILVRQTRVQVTNARAARRLELARLELATQANLDPVTGLPNRRALDDRLAEEVERAIRYKQPLSLCFIDLDHFKQVNDDHGHPAGDAALREVGALLRRTARGIDFVARFGGEEFVVLVPGTWSEDAATLGERLRRSVAEHTFRLAEDRPARLTISVGVAGLPEHAHDAASLSDRADRALYTAKRLGRDRVVLFEPTD